MTHEIVVFAEWTDSATLVVSCKTHSAEIACFHNGNEATIEQLAEARDKHEAMYQRMEIFSSRGDS